MTLLCRLDELPENEGRGFTVTAQGRDVPIVVVRRGDRVFAYMNVCPHRGTSLDWMPDRFMDPEGRFLQCATHDARFEVETGHCVAGPCRGDALAAIDVVVEKGQVRVRN
ncbi:MAG: Rieske (2Fe-2S) protein [Ectothiorhodospiraceae bacterium]|jgi:nitrite reductase/ring-hydroxylating ferredoxin subunit